MRTREEISESIGHTSDLYEGIIEILLDIRDLLSNPKDNGTQ